ncbi:hypothetical protein E2562_026373 [Oryza meyeriana var. granulata]|uniref:AAA+ ATPase domain-containing protein n=1 Tax=Oryza meyeriana var. granulata TaxID=110450 RepID=A0A6G1DNB6_9ORYZ|nr:hypothetical protein E2562_026373 [Oryza meyeriana var. granulata]
MGGSADPEAPTPLPSPAKATPSPSSADGKRLRRCVQSKLSWGPPKAVGGGGGGGGEAGGAGVPPLPAGDGTPEKPVGEEPEKAKKRGRPRKSEAGTKLSSNKETTGLEQDSKDEVILVDESPQKKQRKGRGRNQGATLKVQNRKHCKALESTDGHENRQLRSSQAQAVLPQTSPISVEIDLMTIPSEASPVNDNVDALDNEDKPQLIVDLRSEAKIAAEENRRLSSGKKMHPFFASRKIHKGAGQDVLNVEDEDMDSLRAFERDPPLWPIHVLYEMEATMPIHWSNKWLIADKSFLCTSSSEQNSAKHADPVKDLPNFCGKQNKSKFSSLDVIDVDDECLLTSSSCCHPFECKQQERVQHELPEVTLKGCRPAYYLWTDKYRPETAAQVCGNTEHVKFLSEWLKGWDERGHKSKQHIVANGSMNGRYCQDGSDIDYSEDASDYENVLLITGPVGCGKSAAVFACAREQGFNVIEVNTSDMRNGAYVRQKFEEATKSHGLEKWSQEEIISLPISDSLDPASETPGTAGSKQVINKTLILFEDVDTVFDEDRGFISTILKMVETTKWPIILTSNKKDPTLPHLLAQLVLDFRYPSSAELLSHVDMICKSEGVKITVPQLKHIIDVFLGDIRKTMMLLQFWYQGKQQYTERSNKCLSCPSLLDLDAVHSTVPKILPWDFPCKLSETIYMEIDKTIMSAEEKKKQMEVSEFEGLKLQTTPLTKGRSAGKTRKPKKSKLKRGRSAECNDVSPCKNDLDDFHDSPDIPLPSNHERIRNRRGAVLFSESDDDLADAHTAKDATFTVQEGSLLPQSSELPCLHGHGISNIIPEIAFFQQSSVPHLRREVISNQLCFPSGSRAFETTRSFQNQLESNMPGPISQICDTFMSQGMSCVPESSFIVGVESASTSSDDLLSSLVSNGLSALRNDSTYTASIVALEDTNKVENQLTTEPQKCMEDEVGETCEAYVELSDRNEHASCSITGYQLMDECSRAESVWLLSGKKNNDSCKVEHVQDTWNRLLRCHPVLPCDMNHNRSVSGALKRVSRVSDLISESDLMLTRCHPFSNDISDPSLTPCTEPDGFSSYSKQLEMGSIYAQHALCIFPKDFRATDDGFVDLSQELLFNSTTTTSLGKLISSGISCGDGSGNISHIKHPTSCISKRRDQQARLCEVLLLVVPPKLSQSLRGPAFVDYLSSMSQISRLENMQLFECKASSKQRRCRQSRHYLSSGALSLSAEDIELLEQSSRFSDRRESEKIKEQAIS